MLRLINDEKCIASYRTETINTQIYTISYFLEKRPQFFALCSSVDQAREFSRKLTDPNSFNVLYLKAKVYVPWSKVISAYDRNCIYYNRKKYSVMRDSEILGNIVHETSHHFGYKHSFDWTRERKYSVSYYTGYLYEFLSTRYDPFRYKDETDLADLVTAWRIYINHVI